MHSNAPSPLHNQENFELHAPLQQPPSVPTLWKDSFPVANNANLQVPEASTSGSGTFTSSSSANADMPLDFNAFWSTFQTSPVAGNSTSEAGPSAKLGSSSADALWAPEEAASFANRYGASDRREEAPMPSQRQDVTSTLPTSIVHGRSSLGSTTAYTAQKNTAGPVVQIPQPTYTSPTDSCTSGDTEKSYDSTARGIAFVSLEAAAEGHYLGKSSGATWASLILGCV